MKEIHGNAWRAGGALLATVLGSACGPGEASEAAETTAMELVKSAQEDPRQAFKTVTAAALDDVELPSHRRLKAFLPESLPGLPYAALESEEKRSQGRAVAEGRYQPSQSDYANRVEIEIGYYGKRIFNATEQLFGAGLGQRKEVLGFDAIGEEENNVTGERFELKVRLSPELWVEVSGPGAYENIRDVAMTVDLAALADALADGQLFIESDEDRLERALLSRTAIEALLPARLGALENRGGNSFAQLQNAPLHSRASAQYGAGMLSLIDYGDASVAQAIPLEARSLQGFVPYAAGNEDTVSEEPLEVSGGRGTWAVQLFEPPRASVLALHLSRGRFVAEYTAPFVPAGEIDASLPDDMRRELERAHKEMGAGAFASIEEQRDAVVGALEALDLDAFEN